jgi:uncharacterized glyoxalase superfamily protein PhnB
MAVYPCLSYCNVREALHWLELAFGVQGHILDQAGNHSMEAVHHAILHVGEGTILVESERPPELHGRHAGMGWIYVAVSDADAHYQRAKAAGARISSDPHAYGDGFRGYSAEDLEGNLWTFGTAQP